VQLSRAVARGNHARANGFARESTIAMIASLEIVSRGPAASLLAPRSGDDAPRDSADLSRRHFRVNSANAPVMAPREGLRRVGWGADRARPVLRVLCRTAWPRAASR